MRIIVALSHPLRRDPRIRPSLETQLHRRTIVGGRTPNLQPLARTHGQFRDLAREASPGPGIQSGPGCDRAISRKCGDLTCTPCSQRLRVQLLYRLTGQKRTRLKCPLCLHCFDFSGRSRCILGFPVCRGAPEKRMAFTACLKSRPYRMYT